MTLPLIHTLANVSPSEKKAIMSTIRKYNTDSQKVADVIQRIYAAGGVQYAQQKMEEYQRKAIEILYQMPDVEARKSLERLVSFVVTRDK